MRTVWIVGLFLYQALQTSTANTTGSHLGTDTNVDDTVHKSMVTPVVDPGHEHTDKHGDDQEKTDTHADDPEHKNTDKDGDGPVPDSKSSHKWGYNLEKGNGPEHWPEIESKCGKHLTRQSPVDIQLSQVKYNESLPNIHLIGNFAEKGQRLSIKNNGHTVQVDFESASTISEVFVTGGGLINDYQVVQLHLHWGSNETRGSEHRINNKMYPLELHVVSSDVHKTDAVARASNQLAVLGIFFEISPKDNEALSPILSSLNEITEPNQNTTIEWFDIRMLLPPGTNKYYRYEGSLTTPPCSEIVIWTVFTTPQTISNRQLEIFRSLIEGHAANGDVVKLQDNFRPPAALAGRQIWSSFRIDPDDKTITTQPSSASSKTVTMTVLMIVTMFSVFRMVE